jgi:hypothetical protein
MHKSRERLSIRSLRARWSKSGNAKKKRSSIRIQPRDVRNTFVELRILTTYYLTPPRLPKLKRVLRFATDLLGVAIGLSVISFLVAQTLMNSSLALDVRSAPFLVQCVAMQGCKKLNDRPESSSSRPAQLISPVAILVPLPLPTPRSLPAATPSPTPTPSIALFSVIPGSLTVSYSHACLIRAAILLTLKNIGGAPLVWWLDKAKTSPGIRIVDPTRAYLLQPGQSVNANVYCSPADDDGHYTLQILYNAGEVTIPFTVTA